MGLKARRRNPARAGLRWGARGGMLMRFRQDAADAGRVCGGKTDRPLDSRAPSSQRSRAVVLHLVKLEPLTEP